VLFYLFFQISKQNPALSQVNAFAEDPYDAVGSFGVQLAVFTALLSLVRAFRPYHGKKVLDGQKLLLLRGEYISCLSVAVTLAADVVAIIRYPSLWMGLAAGHVLAALLAGMALLTGLVGWLIYRSTRNIIVPSPRGVWTRAILISIVGILVLALYPESWRQGVPRALFTALVGEVLFFVAVWAFVMAISPSMEMPFEDFIDDLASVYRWLKARTGHLAVLYNMFEKIRDVPFVRPVLSWLNPRKHTWNVCILIGLLMGLVLALVETTARGGPQQIGRFAIVAAVFMSLEGAGVLLGYALLAKPLGLFRRDPGVKMSLGAYQKKK
jgi:hypothetical protein